MSKRHVCYAVLATLVACSAAEVEDESVGGNTSALTVLDCGEKGCTAEPAPAPVKPPPPPSDGGSGGGGYPDAGKVDASADGGGSTDAGPPKDGGTEGGGSEGGTDGGTGALDLRRSFAVTDQVILNGFSFQRVMTQLAAQSATATTPLGLYHQWWDTQRRAAQGVTTGPHCDDQTTGGVPSHNGFPWQCARNEGDLAATDPFNPAGPAFVFPIGLFNRFDLAPASGANCGEHRIVFGNTTSRNLIIFEAVLPNPTPSCGIDACRPVADFWAGLSNPALSAATVQSRLEQFYFNGLPGFEPVVHVNHYGAVGGQVRSNQFMSGPNQQLWNLKEFKLGKVCPPGAACRLELVPVTVKTNPGAQLFSDSSGHPQQGAFQSEFTGSMVGTLAQNDINGFGMSVPNVFNGGQSQSQSFDSNPTSPTITNNYSQVFAPGGRFAGAIQGRLAQIGSPLTPSDIVARATTQSCGGCHQFSNFRALGGGLTWPPSLGFVHVSEQQLEAGAFGQAFAISQALKTLFLPHRRDVMTSFLQHRSTSCSPFPKPRPSPTPVVVLTETKLEEAPSKETTIGGTRSVH